MRFFSCLRLLLAVGGGWGDMGGVGEEGGCGGGGAGEVGGMGDGMGWDVRDGMGEGGGGWGLLVRMEVELWTEIQQLYESHPRHHCITPTELFRIFSAFYATSDFELMKYGSVCCATPSALTYIAL